MLVGGDRGRKVKEKREMEKKGEQEERPVIRRE